MVRKTQPTSPLKGDFGVGNEISQERLPIELLSTKTSESGHNLPAAEFDDRCRMSPKSKNIINGRKYHLVVQMPAKPMETLYPVKRKRHLKSASELQTHINSPLTPDFLFDGSSVEIRLFRALVKT